MRSDFQNLKSVGHSCCSSPDSKVFVEGLPNAHGLTHNNVEFFDVLKTGLGTAHKQSWKVVPGSTHGFTVVADGGSSDSRNSQRFQQCMTFCADPQATYCDGPGLVTQDSSCIIVSRSFFLSWVWKPQLKLSTQEIELKIRT